MGTIIKKFKPLTSINRKDEDKENKIDTNLPTTDYFRMCKNVLELVFM